MVFVIVILVTSDKVVKLKKKLIITIAQLKKIVHMIAVIEVLVLMVFVIVIMVTRG